MEVAAEAIRGVGSVSLERTAGGPTHWRDNNGCGSSSLRFLQISRDTACPPE